MNSGFLLLLRLNGNKRANRIIGKYTCLESDTKNERPTRIRMVGGVICLLPSQLYFRNIAMLRNDIPFVKLSADNDAA
jgi:hypothetical protein